MAGGRPAARGRLPPRRREVPLRYSAGAALAPGNGFCPLRGRGIWRQEAAVELSFGCRKRWVGAASRRTPNHELCGLRAHEKRRVAGCGGCATDSVVVDRCSCPEKAGGDPEERDSGTRTPLHLPATHTLASRGGAGRAAVPGTRKSRGAQKLLATGGRWCCGCHVGVGRVRVSAGDTEQPSFYSTYQCCSASKEFSSSFPLCVFWRAE
ncbi:uncharacterized protein LOC133625103 isoform X2 [Colius striatus]|uniref:uncharacterized protein LOC133625103 isoform X2 n=1 Tax=Colius striatus TaxID=57412 RepID=UPI002B1E7AA3|nr:uncharacterized protein LOC133625103 isoform X2 [Colius striatus]